MSKRFRPHYIEYQEAFDHFVEERKEINKALENGTIGQAFQNLLSKAAKNDAVAMDVLAYYYKSGITNFLKEDYKKYLYWQLLACAKGNCFAIDKMQFLFNASYDAIVEDERFDEIAYKNDLTDENYMSVIGKAIAKVMVKKYQINAEDLANSQNESHPFQNEYLAEFRKDLDSSFEDIIEKLN